MSKSTSAVSATPTTNSNESSSSNSPAPAAAASTTSKLAAAPGSGIDDAYVRVSHSANGSGSKKEVNWQNHPPLVAAKTHTITPSTTPFSIKAQLAQMLKGGVIMDVTTVEEARIAEAAGACAVMALERVPSDIRRDGGVARMSHPAMIKAIQAAVSIPVMAKVRVGHFVEAQILQALEVDFVDESEVLTPADDQRHILKTDFSVPFVCGCRNLGEALRRIQEGAAMIRTKGEAGTGNVIEAVRHARQVADEIRKVIGITSTLELAAYAREIGVDIASLQQVQACGRLPVVQFAAGGVATPADAALMMQLGMDGVFVGSGIFRSENPATMASAMVQAVTHFRDPKKLAEISETVGEAMKGLEIDGSKMVLFATREQP